MSSLFSIHWGLDWLWSIPLIVLTVLFHAIVLTILNRGVHSLMTVNGGKSFRHMVSIVALGGSALCATVAHGFEAWFWAIAYFLSGAISNQKASMEFSLGAMTTFGGNPVVLGPGWELMGALEALSGWIAFGLTAAFLFTIMRKVWATDQLL
jgi:hypothetical protein